MLIPSLLRRVAARRAVALTVVVTLALGLAASTAVFSIANAVFFRQLPWPDADRLVMVYTVLPQRRTDPAWKDSWDRGLVSWQTADGLKKLSTFSEIAVWAPAQWTVGESRQDLVEMLYASSSFLRLLGVRPLEGRTFTAGEDDNASDVVLISDHLWTNRFGRSRDAIGQTLSLGPSYPNARQKPYTIIGVLPRGFNFKGPPPDVILPSGLLPLGWRESDQLAFRVLAQLSPNTSLDAASGVAERALRGSASPETRSGRLVPLMSDEMPQGARPFWFLFASSALLLVLSCSNVACLLVEEAWARRHETAVRIALGGDRRRILWDVALEHVVLAVIAAVVSLLLATWLVPVIVTIAPGGLPTSIPIVVDARVAGFGLLLAVLTGLAAAVAPGLLILSSSPSNVLARTDHRSSNQGHLAQQMLVAAQLTIALILLVCAGMLSETVRSLLTQPLGFDADHLAIVRLTVTKSAGLGAPTPNLDSADNGRSALERRLLQGIALRNSELLATVSSLPGVNSAAGTTAAPFAGQGADTEVRLAPDSSVSTVVKRVGVSADYFRVLRVPMLSGRRFDHTDVGVRVAIVSRAFETQVFGGDATGRHFWNVEASTEPFTVIGVVDDVRTGPLTEPVATFYTFGGRLTQVVIRTSTDPDVILPQVRNAIESYDPSLIVTAMSTMDTSVQESIGSEHMRAIVTELFGGSALFLAAVGLFGLVVRRIADRRHELCIRVALGASNAHIRSLIVSESSKTIALGIIMGLPLSFATATLVRALLFGVSPHAVYVYVWAIATLGTAAMIAIVTALSRAGRIDPARELRS